MSVPAVVERWPDDEPCVGQRGHVGHRPGGDAAFTAVFQEHYAGCLRLARRLVRDEGLAHEVVQEVFLAWWRAAGGAYRADRGELGTWLSTITHHKAVDAVRTHERHRRLLAAVSALPLDSEQRLVDEVVWWELGKQSLVAALPTLTAAQREVLDLAYVQGLTQAQIAERLGIPLGTVKSRTHAGLLRLRGAVGTSWTPTGPIPRAQPEAASTSSRTSQHREDDGVRPQGSAATVREDIDRCAAVLARIAAEERADEQDSAAMVRAAAALVDRHGDEGMYGLVVALARSAVVDGGTPPARPRSGPAG